MARLTRAKHDFNNPRGALVRSAGEGEGIMKTRYTVAQLHAQIMSGEFVPLQVVRLPFSALM